MNEQEQISQLSALFDNELPPAQSGMVIRRALKDPALRASWGHYALIGACIRGEPVHAGRLPDVAERVRARLAAEAEHEAASAPALAGYDTAERSRFARYGRGVLGGAIAAGVAIVSLVVVRNMSPLAAVPAVQLAQAGVPAAVTSQPQAQSAVSLVTPVQVAALDGAPPSYTTPVDNSPAAQRFGLPLANYVVAHSEVVASASLSTVMNANYDPTLGAVEMTKDEIGARR